MCTSGITYVEFLQLIKLAYGTARHYIPASPNGGGETKALESRKLVKKWFMSRATCKPVLKVKGQCHRQKLGNNFQMNFKLVRSIEHLLTNILKQKVKGQHICNRLCAPLGLMNQKRNDVESSSLLFQICDAVLRSRGQVSRLHKPRHIMCHN